MKIVLLENGGSMEIRYPKRKRNICIKTDCNNVEYSCKLCKKHYKHEMRNIRQPIHIKVL